MNKVLLTFLKYKDIEHIRSLVNLLEEHSLNGLNKNFGRWLQSGVCFSFVSNQCNTECWGERRELFICCHVIWPSNSFTFPYLLHTYVLGVRTSRHTSHSLLWYKTTEPHCTKFNMDVTLSKQGERCKEVRSVPNVQFTEIGDDLFYYWQAKLWYLWCRHSLLLTFQF